MNEYTFFFHLCTNNLCEVISIDFYFTKILLLSTFVVWCAEFSLFTCYNLELIKNKPLVEGDFSQINQYQEKNIIYAYFHAILTLTIT